jgi:hypothetical protein
MNWQELASASPYRTAVAVDDALRRGDVGAATTGLQELIDALSRSDRRALKSYLVRLMTHVIKWRTQPAHRSRSWRATIRNARREIAGIQDDTPSLTRAVIESMWAACLEAATDDAEAEMNQESAVSALTWGDVFEAEYELD